MSTNGKLELLLCVLTRQPACNDLSLFVKRIAIIRLLHLE